MGTLIPLLLYTSWIYVNLGGGIDNASSSNMSSSIMLTIFSIVTICGSSICGGMSMAEEIETFMPQKMNNNNGAEKQIENDMKNVL